MEYPKMETLFERGPDHKVIVCEDKIRLREVFVVDRAQWIVTEKIDGTNVRVRYAGDHKPPVFMGRTDNAQMPTFLFQHLHETFSAEKFEAAFPWLEQARQTPANLEHGKTTFPITLYGEGYGPKIQQGGGNYRTTPGFRLFDVMVGGKWLDWHDVHDVAEKLGILTVPVLSFGGVLVDIVNSVKAGLPSIVAHQENDGKHHIAEGVVARTDPTLYDWRGNRIMWKLKTRDF